MARNGKKQLMNAAVVANRVKNMVELREKFIKDGIKSLPVRIMAGNGKTKKTKTVSLIPIADCQNCAACMHQCYDVRSDCWRESVARTRAQNSAIHKANINRYWSEISEYIKGKKVQSLRLNVGGDLSYKDFPLLSNVAKENPDCKILFFTKNYEDVNRYVQESGMFPENVFCIFSYWEGVSMDNPYKFPTSHVIYRDSSGAVTNSEIKEGEFFVCPDDCTECLEENKGCWNLNGGAVGFLAH